MISKVVFIAPKYCVDLKELCKYRGYDEGKLKGLGVKQMAVLYDQNLLDLAYEALSKIDLSNISLLIVSTESSKDLSKPLSAKIVDQFDLNRCFTFETKFACRAGLDAVLMAESFTRTTGKDSVVVCIDEAIYDIGPAEITGGCGCAVIKIEQEGFLDIDLRRSTSYVEDIDDFYKPIDKTTPVVDGRLSIVSYLYCCKNAISYWKKLSRHNVTDYFDKLVFHIPFPKIVKWMSAVLYGHERIKEKRIIHIENVLKNPALFNSWREERKEIESKDDFKEWFKDKVEPSLQLHPFVGNSYTASIWLALISTIKNSKINIDDRIGLCGYGSGAGSLCVETLVKDIPRVEYKLPREKLEVEEYIRWRRKRGID